MVSAFLPIPAASLARFGMAARSASSLTMSTSWAFRYSRTRSRRPTCGPAPRASAAQGTMASQRVISVGASGNCTSRLRRTFVARGLEREAHPLGLVQRLLVFRVGVRVGHDPAARVERDAACRYHRGADQDVGVQAARRGGIEERARVEAARRGLHLVQYLHAPDLGDAGD